MFTRNHSTRLRTSGFTMIEVMVTVMIVGVLAAIAAPSFTGTIATSRVKGATSNLHMLLLKARSEAVKRNASVLVTRAGSDWDADAWNLTWDDPSTLATTQITLATETRPYGVAITPSPGPVSVTYLRSGRVQGNATPTFTIIPADTNRLTKKSYQCRQISIGAGGVPLVKPYCAGDCRCS